MENDTDYGWDPAYDAAILEARTSTDPEVIEAAADCGSLDLQIAVLENPRITTQAFWILVDRRSDLSAYIAAHPLAPPEVLEHLSTSPWPDAREAARRNPNNTDLGRRWADEFAEQAARGELAGEEYPWAIYEGDVVEELTALLMQPGEPLITPEDDPDDETLIDSLKALAASARCPASVLERIAIPVAEALAQTKMLVLDEDGFPTESDRQRLADAPTPFLEILKCVAANAAASTAILRAIAGLAVSSTDVVVARHPQAPLPDLKRMARGRDPEVLLAAATHPSRKVRQLEPILTPLASTEVLAALLANRHVSAGLLDRYRTTTDSSLRRGLAQNERVDRDVLSRLADVEDEDLQARVAANPATPPENLCTLSKHESERVRAAVAGNPEAPEAILAALHTHDGSPAVQRSLAANGRAPRLVHEAAVSSDYLRSSAAQAHGLPPDLQMAIATTNDPAAHLSLASNHTATAESLDALIRDRESAADRLRRPASHQEMGVLYRLHHAIAAHPNASAETLKLLQTTYDRDHPVRLLVVAALLSIP